VARAFTIVELLVTIAIAAVLAGVAAGVWPGLMARADSADALGKIRTMGSAVLHYPSDHRGFLPALFPGQLLEYAEGRGGRIVTECAEYLGVDQRAGSYLVTRLMPRAYYRLAEPPDKNLLRVYVMNTAMTNGSTVLNPFGSVTTAGQPPTGNKLLSTLAGAGSVWMMSTADQQQPNVAGAFWKNNTPARSPLGGKRAVFRVDGAAELVEVSAP
jgi:prepilin-type N-terminal cleavage/methylation domain-containing protein